MRIAVLAIAGALAGCASLDRFDVSLSAEGVLPGTLSAAAPGFAALPAGADVSRQVENQGVKVSDLQSVKLSKGAVSVTAPAGGHLAYLESLELFASAPGLPEVRIAHQDAAFAARQQAYDLVSDGAELKAYVAAPSMSITPKVKLRSRPAQDVQMRLDLTLSVDLTLVE